MFRFATIVLALVALLGAGCAYFNTFYNAKQFYRQAEEERKKSGDTPGAGGASYAKCIDKCLQLIRYHPDSGHVDDALYLIGMSHYYRREYVQALASFQDLADRFPNSDFNEHAFFTAGLASLYLDDTAGATEAFQQLQEHYPESDYNLEAIFRAAEVRLDAQDFAAARAELRRFMSAYPESRFALEAQVLLARTYYDEQRYEEARQEYEAVLRGDISPELRYEALLHIALSRREEATTILADPSLYTEADLPKGLRLEFGADADTTSLQQLPQAPPGKSSVGNEKGEDEEEAEPSAWDEGLGPAGNTDEPGVDSPSPGSPAPEESEAVSPPPDPAVREAMISALPESLQVIRRSAETKLQQAADELRELRKQARKIGRELTHRIELATTQALLGTPEKAIDDLDALAREQPNSAVAAQAYYEIGEINRRQGNFAAARSSYDKVIRQRQGAGPVVLELARKKLVALETRANAVRSLKDREKVLREWRVLHGLEPAVSPPSHGSVRDSVEAWITAEKRFEEMASHLMRVAEIDLFDLDQPRLAIREFQRVLDEFPGSVQGPRAAFAIAWIYDNVLNDTQRALRAYESVNTTFPGSSQAREATDNVRQMLSAVPSTEDNPEERRPR